MWKRDEAVRPPVGGRDIPSAPVVQGPTQVPAAHSVHAPEYEAKRHMERDVVNIGKSVVIKGELNGSEDLTVEGHVEGKIELKEHVLTIGPHGQIKAEVFAKIVIILGEVTGNIMATEKVDIRDSGSVDGDIVAPRVAIAEGAHFRGSVDMQRKAAPAVAAKPDVKPATAASAEIPPGAATPSGPPRVGA
jgi:cytoskeletal protein CcmA (bactofilin family)